MRKKTQEKLSELCNQSEEVSTCDIITATIALPICGVVFIVTLLDCYNSMIPSAHADESGAVGVVLLPPAMAIFVCSIIGFISETCKQCFKNDVK